MRTERAAPAPPRHAPPPPSGRLEARNKLARVAEGEPSRLRAAWTVESPALKTGAIWTAAPQKLQVIYFFFSPQLGLYMI